MHLRVSQYFRQYPCIDLSRVPCCHTDPRLVQGVTSAKLQGPGQHVVWCDVVSKLDTVQQTYK